MSGEGSIIPAERIEKRIFLIRGQKVMLDSDLARLYGVPTKSLNLAVKRNIKRFPGDFRFRLTEAEFESLRFHFETSKGRGGRRYLPHAFTDYGVAMLSSVLNSDRAILVNIEIMRTFGRLRHILATHKDLARKLEELERKYDHQFRAVFDAIRELMTPLPPKRKGVSPVTCRPTRGGSICRSCSTFIRGRSWGLRQGDSLQTELCCRALKQACALRRPPAEVIHHSDRGVQYASQEYREVLQQHRFTQSMSRKGNCYDNAIVESFFHTLKVELTHCRRYQTREEARKDIESYINQLAA